jgi:glyoxylase-like metal-dependent hydrolase (beta-lactamase superfamily II)
MAARPVDVQRLQVGDTRLSHLADGYHRCDPVTSIVGSDADHWREHEHLLDDQGRLVMSMGSLLIETPDGTRALVDLGFGPRTLVLEDRGMDFWGGRLLASLAAVGLSPDDIDLVLYSHLHLDHVGWTTGLGDRLTFPNARHVMSTAEWEHWTGAPMLGGPSETDVSALPDRLELVDGEVEVVPGIVMLPTPGHTPGHCSFAVVDGPHRAVILGDAVHCPVQITHPEWNYAGDIVPAAALRSRAALVAELERPDTVAVGAHFTEAVFGRVLADEMPRRVLFDVAPPPTRQVVAADAPPGSFLLPGLETAN